MVNSEGAEELLWWLRNGYTMDPLPFQKPEDIAADLTVRVYVADGLVVVNDPVTDVSVYTILDSEGNLLWENWREMKLVEVFDE